MIRLTLRSLLAYIDEVSDLTEQQRAELREQIEASDFAKELVHRLTDAANRTRLPAPDLLGLGPADDPNTVAEYLENALPPESVAEFERVCLESDTMLAEVAACHHVLKELLEKPEKLDPADLARVEATVLRALEGGDTAADERLRIEPSHGSAVANGAVMGADDQDAIREAADRIKEEDAVSSRILIGVGAVAALVLGVLAFQIFGPKDVAKVTPPEPAAEEEQAATDGGVAEDGITADPSEDAAAERVDAADEGQPSSDLSEDDTTATPGEDAATPGEAADRPIDPTVGDPEEAASPIGGTEDRAEPIATPTVPQPIEDTADTETPRSNGELTETPAGDAETVDEAPATDPAPAEGAESAADKEPLDVVGRFVGPATAVVAVSDGEGQWLRSSLDAELAPGSRLASFPAFRARIELAGGAELELIGDTVVTLAVSEDDVERPRVVVEHGRLTIAAPKTATSSLAIDVDVSGNVALVEIDPGATVSIQVARPYTPGFNTLAGSPALSVSGWAPKGGVSWASRSATVQAQLPKRWAVNEAGGFVSLASYDGDPGWIQPQGQDLTTERAAATLASKLSLDSPILPQFVEQAADGDLPEVAMLAAKCAASLGLPDTLVGTMNDPAVYVPVVASNVAHLRRLISRDTASAEAVRQVLVDFHGDQTAIDLFFMLGGFNAEQIGSTPAQQRSGAIAQMLDWLQDADAPLAVSRLAIVNLDELLEEPASGQIDPVQDSPFARRKAAQKLDKRLQRGTLELSQPAPTSTAP